MVLNTILPTFPNPSQHDPQMTLAQRIARYQAAFRANQRLHLLDQAARSIEHVLDSLDDPDMIIQPEGYQKITNMLGCAAESLEQQQMTLLNCSLDGEVIFSLYQFPWRNKVGMYLTLGVMLMIPLIQLAKRRR